MSKSVDWHFSENPDGDERGFADAGMETFRKRLFDSVARETIQNSLDARESQRKPVEVTFQHKLIKARDLPGASSLRAAMKRCGEFYSASRKAVAFFSKAQRLLRKRDIHVLQVSDSNTIGLTGDDNHRNTNWHSLIRAVGASSKHGGEGGSFGIGASAPFAASQLRTVFYSTVTGKNTFGFVGVVRLTTHQNSDGVKVNPNGHLGVDGGKRIVDKHLVPGLFRRTKRGTTVSIVGFKPDENWEDEFRLAVIQHFWPAIHFGKLGSV